MGLFGLSKYDKAMSYIDDVEVFYERLVEVFKKNISTHTTKRDISFTPIKEQIERYSIDDISHFFIIYPKDIADDADIVNQYESKEFIYYFNNRYSRPKYTIPFITPDCEKYKIFTTLVLRRGSFAEINNICNDFFDVLDKAFNLANEYKDSFFNNDYQDLYRRLLPIYYRGKGAILWFNYLNKKEE